MQKSECKEIDQKEGLRLLFLLQSPTSRKNSKGTQNHCRGFIRIISKKCALKHAAIHAYSNANKIYC
jgi:hypothetical protein